MWRLQHEVFWGTWCAKTEVNSIVSVSVQTILASVQSLVGGMRQVNEEIRQMQKLRSPQDRFTVVMQVRMS